jgi:tetratricopeptide (TPR) repeat protein
MPENATDAFIMAVYTRALAQYLESLQPGGDPHRFWKTHDLLTQAIVLSPEPRQHYFFRRASVSALLVQSRGPGWLRESVAAIKAHWPKDPRAWTFVGTVISAIDQSAAEEALRKAVSLDPGFADGHHELAIFLSRSHRFDEAMVAYARSEEFDPDNARFLSNHGLALSQRGDHKAAVAMHRRAIEVNPSYWLAYRRLGVELDRQGAWIEAEALLEEAVRLEPKAHAAWNDLGDVRFTHFSKGTNLEPERRRELLNGAIEAFREATTLFYGNPLYQANLNIALRADAELRQPAR